MSSSIGRVGIRSWELSDCDAAVASDCASELEEFGFGALWIRGKGFFERAAGLASATTRTVVASSVVSVWDRTASEVSAARARLHEHVQQPLLVGLGVSHAPIVNRGGRRYSRPLDTMVAYLSELDGADVPLHRDDRVIAALGPHMLELARDQSLGAHPYLAPVEHTVEARRVLGSDALLAPAVVVVGESDRTRARDRGREHLARPYLDLPNYTRNLWRLGFGPTELANGGADRLVDALVLWGEPERIASRVGEHLDAGADHVALHVLPQEPSQPPRATWRRLAQALGLS